MNPENLTIDKESENLKERKIFFRFVFLILKKK